MVSGSALPEGVNVKHGEDVIARLADEFVACMAETLAACDLDPHLNLQEIDAENARRGDGSCASHDYVDANVVMLEAFERVIGCAPWSNVEREAPTEEDRAMEAADLALWHAAWDRAKADGFWATWNAQNSFGGRA